jgi:MFS family permease
MTRVDHPESERRPAGRAYPWFVVGLLWFCGFFNYADRQAVFSVFPLLGDEFGLSDLHKGAIGSSFMVVYALSAPIAGYVVDRLSRRWVIPAGLAVWSVICAATGTARGFRQLIFYRAAEGLGESFYFPASMSLLADYHGPRTRSRAMSVHQTSVYAGTAVGGILAGVLGQRFGWRAPFLVLGLIGVVYATALPWLVVEPVRGASEAKPERRLEPGDEPAPPPAGLVSNLGTILRVPAALMLLVVFAGANFVAATLLAWLPDFVFTRYALDLSQSATVAGVFFPGGNAVGALCGGALADAAARRVRGGRVLVQAAGLFLAAPCVWFAGRTGSLSVLIPALVGIGLCKGVYDANIFASVYDVVPARVRGTAAGLMNTAAWTAGGMAPTLVGYFSTGHGLGAVIAWTAAVYVSAGCLALAAAGLTARRLRTAT